MLFYDDGSQGKSLGSVTWAFGQLAEDGPRTYTDVTTVLKRRAADPSLRDEPVTLNDVCEPLPHPIYGAREGYVPKRFQPSADLRVNGREVAAFAATGTRGWALCADLGDILVSVTGDGTRGGPVDLTKVEDLGPSPVATTDSDCEA